MKDRGMVPSLTHKRLDRALAKVPEQRQKIFEVLRQRSWFKNTSDDLQLELATLPHEPKVNHIPQSF